MITEHRLWSEAQAWSWWTCGSSSSSWGRCHLASLQDGRLACENPMAMLLSWVDCGAVPWKRGHLARTTFWILGVKLLRVLELISAAYSKRNIYNIKFLKSRRKLHGTVASTASWLTSLSLPNFCVLSFLYCTDEKANYEISLPRNNVLANEL